MNHPSAFVLRASIHTAIGTCAGTLKDTPGSDLDASVIRAAPTAVNAEDGKPHARPFVVESPTSGCASK